MAEIACYFFDTYAFCELFKGNPNYKPYSKDISIVTTALNLIMISDNYSYLPATVKSSGY